jgi:predicted esterase
VFLGHGTADNVVTFDKGEASRDALINTFGFKKVSWHSYDDMLHSVNPEELQDIFDFLESVVPEDPSNM